MTTEAFDLPTPGVDPLGSASGLRSALLLPVGLRSRATHAVVDAGVLGALLAFTGLIGLAGLLAGAPPAVVSAAWLLAGAAVLVAVTVLWPAHDGGRTAGMRRTGLRVVDRHGRPAGTGSLAVRAAFLPLDVLAGPVLVACRADRRRLGDLVAGTQVVRDVRTVDLRDLVSAAGAPVPRPGTARSPRAPWPTGAGAPRRSAGARRPQPSR